MVKKCTKREDYLSWDDYFMYIAILSGERSKDPSTQVGACIVSKENKILGTGYNGMPIGCDDDLMTWEREGKDISETKYAYIVHAEANAILNATTNLKGSRIYVFLHPCNECAKLIIQSGIKEVIYLSNKYAHLPTFKAAPKMFKIAGIKTRKLKLKKNEITLKART